EVAPEERALRRPIAQGAPPVVRVPGERVPEQHAPGHAAEGAPDDAARRLEPEGRVPAGRPESGSTGPGEPHALAARQLALAGERDAREPAAAIADRLAHQDEPRPADDLQIGLEVPAPPSGRAGQVEGRILVAIRVGHRERISTRSAKSVEKRGGEFRHYRVAARLIEPTLPHRRRRCPLFRSPLAPAPNPPGSPRPPRWLQWPRWLRSSRSSSPRASPPWIRPTRRSGGLARRNPPRRRRPLRARPTRLRPRPSRPRSRSPPTVRRRNEKPAPGAPRPAAAISPPRRPPGLPSSGARPRPFRACSPRPCARSRRPPGSPRATSAIPW